MKHLIIILMLMLPNLSQADYSYIELSQGIKINTGLWKESNWNGKYPTAFSIGHHWDYRENFYFRAQFNHLSNIDRGAPFNTKSETWLDQINVTIGIKF